MTVLKWITVLRCNAIFGTNYLTKQAHLFGCIVSSQQKIVNLHIAMENKESTSTPAVTEASSDGGVPETMANCGDEQSIQASTSTAVGTSDKNNDLKPLSKSAQKKMLRMAKIKALKSQQKAKAKKKANNQSGDNSNPFDLKQTDYYFENGLRKVYPYYYTFSSYVKGRWIGREVLDVLSKEFLNSPPEEYEDAIRTGKLTVNGKPVSSNYKLKQHDILEHVIHRHENPVTDTPLDIIAETDSLLVINKPPSIPVHPCGRYRFNSLSVILEKELGYRNLRNFYRLDRLTSGVMVLGKTEDRTTELHSQVANRILYKEYVCRVEGEFPEQTFTCDQPLDTLAHTLKLMRVSSAGKESSTTFTRLSYNGKSSVVKCVPHTGRTHQIRVHLQYLGHPIVNDPFYNSQAFGPNKGKGGLLEKPVPEIMSQLMQEHNIGLWKIGENPAYLRKLEELKNQQLDNCQGDKLEKVSSDDSQIETQQSHVSICVKLSHNASDQCQEKALNSEEEPASKRAKTETDGCGDNDTRNMKFEISAMSKNSIQRPGYDLSKTTLDMNCSMCKILYKDPEQKELLIYLHALTYKGPNWEYSAPLPEWAKEDWNEPDSST